MENLFLHIEREFRKENVVELYEWEPIVKIIAFLRTIEDLIIIIMMMIIIIIIIIIIINLFIYHVLKN